MRIIYLLYALLTAFLLAGCGKEFLDKKRESSQVVPRAIGDYLAILDSRSIMGASNFALSTLSEDDFDLDTSFLNSLSGTNVWERNAYIWADDVDEGNESRDWNNAYQRIMISNLALDVEKLDPSDDPDLWNTTKGTARFYRAWNYYQLIQQFSKPYAVESASKDPGVPLRLDYDVTIDIGRGSVKEVYDQILEDISIAKELLPHQTPSKFRPNRAAASALLARIYLQMGEYESALREANTSLSLNGELLNYNMLDVTKQFTFQDMLYGQDNPEVLFYSTLFSAASLSWSRVNMHKDLLTLYDDGDLRKDVFFAEEEDGRTWFKGSMSGLNLYFVGLAVDEVYLIKAEALLRTGNVREALSVLNQFRASRFDQKIYQPLQEQNERALLGIILGERRKQLVFRGIRWSDLRRLNTDPEYATSIVRWFNGRQHVLQPNSPRWVWPLPYNETSLYPQNDR